jgi:hypothetical protein
MTSPLAELDVDERQERQEQEKDRERLRNHVKAAGYSFATRLKHVYH